MTAYKYLHSVVVVNTTSGIFPKTDAELRKVYISDKRSIVNSILHPNIKVVYNHSYVS